MEQKLGLLIFSTLFDYIPALRRNFMLSRTVRSLATPQICLILTVPSITAAPKSPLGTVFDSVFTTTEFRQVSISPDGQWVALVQERHKIDGSRSAGSGIYIANLPSFSISPRRILSGTAGASYGDIAWSPDSRNLALLCDAGTPGQFQLFIANIVGGSYRKLTSLSGALATPRWSPDGRKVALLFTENAPRISVM